MDGTIIKSIRNEDILGTILNFVSTLDEELQIKILNVKDVKEGTNLLHTITSDRSIRKTLEILDRNVVKKLMNEKDVNGDDVCQRSLKLGLDVVNRRSDAERWLILAEYKDEQND